MLGLSEEALCWSGNDAPEGWTTVALGELLSFKNGVNANKDAYGDGTKFANVLEIISHTRLTEEHIPGMVRISTSDADRFSVKFGDLLFNRTSETLDEVAMSSVYLGKSHVAFGGFVIRGRLRSDRLDPLFAGYALRSQPVREQIVRMGQGAVRANIGQESLSKVVLQVPPPSEQKAIAAALGDADDLIASLDELIAKKRDIRAGVMQQLLTGRMRLPEFQKRQPSPTMAGNLPRDWRLVRLQEACSVVKDGTHFSPKSGGSDFLYVTSRNIGAGTLDLSDVDRISTEEHRKIYSGSPVKKGDLLLTKDGASTGNCAINTIDEEFSLLSSVAFLRFYEDKFKSEYFLYQILSEYGQVRIKEQMSGNAITRLTLEKINKLEFPCPSLPEQLAIVEVLTDIQTDLQLAQARRDKAIAVQRGMMQQLLTGRIRLT